MKRLMLALSIIALAYISIIDTADKKEVVLGTKLVRSTPREVLKQYIARIKQQGLTVRGQTPEVDAIIQEILRSLSASDIKRIQELDEQAKRSGSGSSASGIAGGIPGAVGGFQGGSGTAGGGSGTSGQGGGSAGIAGGGSGIGGLGIGSGGAVSGGSQIIAQEEQQSHTGGILPPPPPPIGGGSGKQTQDTRIKPAGKPQDAQEIVQREDEQIAADSPLAAISDLKLLTALETLAAESFTGNDIKVRATTLAQPASFNDAYQAYMFLMRDIFAGLEADTGFKKPASLRRIMREEGPVNEFIKHNVFKGALAQDAFLTKVYQALSSANALLVQELVGLLTILLFNPRDTRVAELVRTIIINLAVSQRKDNAASASRLDQVESDGAAIQLFNEIFNQYRRNESGISSTELSQDYIDALYRYIDVLRVNPSFLRYANLQGSAARALWEKETNPVFKSAKIPVLYLLGSVTDPKAFRTVESFMGPVRTQLLFDNQGLHAFERDENRKILVSMLADHERRLARQLGKKSPEEIFEATVFGKKTIALRDVLATLKEVAKIPGLADEQKTAIKELEANLTSTQPNAEKIKELLQSIVTINDQQVDRINDLVKDLGKRNTLLAIFKKVLTQAQQAYKTSKQPVGSMMYQALKQDRTQIPFGRIESVFTSVTREPDDVWALFSSLIGSIADFENLLRDTGVVNRAGFLTLIEPYGTLIKLMQSIQDQAKKFDTDQKAGPAKKWALLMNSLEAMNNATGDSTSKDYAQVIKDNRGILIRGTYRNMLTPLITALEQSRIEDAQRAIIDLVAKAQVGIESKPEFKKALTSFTQFVISTLLAEQLVMLNELNNASGEAAIPGIPLEGADRFVNAQWYRELKGAFKPIVDVLIPQGKLIDSAAFAQLNDGVLTRAFADVSSSIDTIAKNSANLARTTPEAAQAIMRAMQDYLDNVQRTIMSLKKAAMAQGVAAPVQPVQIPGGGVPPPPPPPPLQRR